MEEVQVCAVINKNDARTLSSAILQQIREEYNVFIRTGFIKIDFDHNSMPFLNTNEMAVFIRGHFRDVFNVCSSVDSLASHHVHAVLLSFLTHTWKVRSLIDDEGRVLPKVAAQCPNVEVRYDGTMMRIYGDRLMVESAYRSLLNLLRTDPLLGYLPPKYQPAEITITPPKVASTPTPPPVIMDAAPAPQIQVPVPELKHEQPVVKPQPQAPPQRQPQQPNQPQSQQHRQPQPQPQPQQPQQQPQPQPQPQLQQSQPQSQPSQPQPQPQSQPQQAAPAAQVQPTQVQTAVATPASLPKRERRIRKPKTKQSQQPAAAQTPVQPSASTLEQPQPRAPVAPQHPKPQAPVAPQQPQPQAPAAPQQAAAEKVQWPVQQQQHQRRPVQQQQIQVTRYSQSQPMQWPSVQGKKQQFPAQQVKLNVNITRVAAKTVTASPSPVNGIPTNASPNNGDVSFESFNKSGDWSEFMNE
eukprot:TRINITY_DN643_c0_g1_i1.p1 TRINITY_DN643_c0_g1~~TRINITY_DN643_c0_g1_i1.p1  ORF type:complete len:479 (-),score=155.25 TRINITY_DN643_c0_g1_i1:35-1438(-)